MDQLTVTLQQPMAEVETAVRAALGDQGFGILAEIDVAEIIATKLGVHRAPLKILGACNPVLANRALDVSLDVALSLPCNVVLYAIDDDTTTVTIADPAMIMPGDSFRELVEDARERLGAALASLL
ncbi:MAG: DUF302 domain-containing protein [Acidimicrobiales bacterium]